MKVYIDSLDDLYTDSNNEVPGNGWIMEIKSSIYDMFPTATLSGLTLGEYSPDVLGYFLGSGMDIQYQLVDNEDDSKASPSISFPNMLLEEMQTIEGKSTYFFKNELAFFQKTDVQGAFDNSADSIMSSLRCGNSTWATYGMNFKTSDAQNKVFRALGQTEEDFIRDQIYPNFLIENDTPLFWVGLDKMMNLDSFSGIIARSEQTDVICPLGNYVGPTEKSYNKIKQSTLREGGLEIKASTFDLCIGSTGFSKQLTPSLSYYNNTTPWSDEVSKIAMKPTGPSGSYLPISRMMSILSDGSDSGRVLTFRPDTHIQQEAKNLSLMGSRPFVEITLKGVSVDYGKKPETETDEDGNEVKTSYNEATGDEKLLLAGQTIFITLPYFYSLYSGKYVIKEIYYNIRVGGQTTVNLVCDSNCVGTKCYDCLESDSADKDFNYKFHPTVALSNLIKSK